MLREYEGQWEYNDEERADIQLCLTCPYPNCNNCLEKNHTPGVRPERKLDSRQKRVQELLRNTQLPLYKIAKLAHCSLAVAKGVQYNMMVKGELTCDTNRSSTSR